jgi:hypothetical protein
MVPMVLYRKFFVHIFSAVVGQYCSQHEDILMWVP